MGKTMTDDERNMRRVVGANWGLSITVVIALVGGIVFNLKLFSDMGERNARIETTLFGLTNSVDEIKKNMGGYTATMNAGLLKLREENSVIRERLAKIEAEMEIARRNK